MAERFPVVRRIVLGIVGAGVVGCGGAPPPPPVLAPVPQPLSAAEIETFARLLELEDRREYDVWTIGPAASAREPRVRARAALTVARLRDPAGRTLARILLEDEDSTVAATAAFALGQLTDTAAVEHLGTILSDTHGRQPRSTVAAEAARALGRIATDEARTVLVVFLASADTRDPFVAPVVAEALLALSPAPESAIPAILRWIDHDDPEVRWRAAYALTRPPRPSAIVAAMTLVEDPDPLVRAMALRGLGRTVVDAARVPRSEVLAGILRLVEDSAYVVRIEAIRALGTYAESVSVSRLTALLASDRPHDVAAGLESLGRLGASATASVSAVSGVATDTSRPPYLRGLALSTLAAIDTARGGELVSGFAAASDWRLRAAAADALARGGVNSLPMLRTLARDPDPRVAAAVARAAVEAVDSTSMDLVRPLLVELLSSPDVYVRAAALEGMAVLADPSTYPALLDAYDRATRDAEPDAALAAIDAIASIARTGSLQPQRSFFARFSRPSSYHVRSKAVEAFGPEARSAWGDPRPIEIASAPDYLALVERWQAEPNPADSRVRARIETDAGAIDVELLGDVAPLTVANFLGLAERGYFDGQEWPRVVPNFVVQGGDPRGDTSGGPGYTIRDELNRARFSTGTVGMALAGPDTGGSQFFIAHSPQPHLDGTYTIFGRVVAGQAVLERLLPGDRIISIRALDNGA